jgi:cysteinylglycine-S-conjugate dipeptidase
MHDDLASAVDADLEHATATLEDLVRIPSVSAPGFDGDRVKESAAATADLIRASGATNVRVLELDDSHPAVYGEVPGPDGAPTVLLYAHHDVQPPGPESEWETAPFTPVRRGGRLYGRGAADDKSGIAMHAAIVRIFGSASPVTLKLFFEGEEEVGSTHLSTFLDRYSDDLAADVIVIADSGTLETGTPALTTSLRGIVDCIVEVRTLGSAVHSGGFGGVAPDALTALARLLACLHDEDGEVAVPGLHREETDVDIPEADFRAMAGLLDGVRLLGSGTIAGRLWTKPAISVLAIDAPNVTEAINQLVPVARAKVSLRLAPGDDPDRAMEALEAHLVASAPWGAKVAVERGSIGSAFQLTTEGASYQAFRDGFSEAYGKETIEIGQGGSIPFVAAFQERYPESSILLTGIGDPQCAAHAPNESVDLADFRSAILGEAIALRLLGNGA